MTRSEKIVAVLLEWDVYKLPNGFQFAHDESTARLETRSGQQVGYMAWRPASPKIGVTNRTIEIEHLNIDRQYQRQGLGEAALRHFKTIIQKIYPSARYVVAKTATSKGIVNLLRRVFGPEIRTRGLENLPTRSPNDWVTATNRGYALFDLM